MVNVFARIGVTLNLTQEEFEIIKEQDDFLKIDNIMKNVINEKRYTIGGDSYIPSDEENDSYELGSL